VALGFLSYAQHTQSSPPPLPHPNFKAKMARDIQAEGGLMSAEGYQGHWKEFLSREMPAWVPWSKDGWFHLGTGIHFV